MLKVAFVIVNGNLTSKSWQCPCVAMHYSILPNTDTDIHNRNINSNRTNQCCGTGPETESSIGVEWHYITPMRDCKA
jgi:hypothetical protein